MRIPTDNVPGQELVTVGMAALKRGDLTIEALLVAVGAPRLKALGLDVRDTPDVPDHPELALYHAIGEAHPEDAHSRYNALIRRLVSYEHELERRQSRPSGATSGGAKRRDACGAQSSVCGSARAARSKLIR